MYKQLLSTGLLTALAIGTVLFTSCHKDDDPDNTPQAVQFTAAINQAVPVTKASGTAWASGDAIGVYMVGTGTTTIVETADNKQHATTGGNVFAPATGHEVYYPINGNSVDFIAYYPYVAGQALSTAYPVNVATQTSQAAIDLLWAKTVGKNKTNGTVALTFDHKLSKLVIKTVAGAGLTATDLANLTVTAKGMNTEAPFDLKTGTLGTTAAPAAIAPAIVTKGSQYEAVVLPAVFAAAGNLTMEFALNNAKSEVFVWECPANEAFEQGKEYTYTMTISRTGVSFTCTINLWTSVSRTGTAW